MELSIETTRSRFLGNRAEKRIRYARFLNGASGISREALKALASRLVRVSILLALLGSFVIGRPVGAVEWEFKPPRVGSVVPPSAWMVDRPLATVTISPEFTFPLQLVYFSSRSERGAFGDKWFCPQLESTVLPRGKGVLVWTPPSGGVIGLFVKKNNAGHFTDPEHGYLAKVTGALTTITGKDGWEYLYRTGRLVTVHAPSGRQLEYGFTGGNLIQVTFRDNVSSQSRSVLSLTRQSNDRVVGLSVNGVQYQFAYGNGADGRLVLLTRPGVRDPEKFEYNRDGLLSSVAVPGGAPLLFKSEFVKFEKGQQHDDPADKNKTGNWRLTDDGVFSYSYDKNGVTARDRSGGWQSYAFAQNRGVETSRNSGGEELIKYYFRAPGRKHDGKLRRVEKNERVLLENFYDKKTGNLIESRDEAGVSTFYEYPAPRKREASLFVGVSTRADDSACDKPVRILRANGKGGRDLVVAIEYDGAGRVLSRTEPGNKITRLSYNARGEIESLTDPAGVRTTMNRDAFGRVNSIVKGDQRQTVVYDDSGRVKSKVQPDGQTTEFSYDPAGNLAAVKQNGVTVTTYQRDANGQVTGQADAIGRATRIERDARGNLTAEHQPNGTVTRYEYDAAGHRTAQIDGKGNRITFRYDQGGRLIEQKNPLGQTLTWTYDSEGRLTGRTNGVQTVTQTYNENGRLKKIDYGAPGEKILYTYDQKGRARKLATPTNCMTLYYDEGDRIIARQFTRGDTKRVIRYSWDTMNRKIAVILSEKCTKPITKGDRKAKAADGYTVLQQTEYAYDQVGRLLELKSNGECVCRYKYDTQGRLMLRNYGNGVSSKHDYDKYGHLTRMEIGGGVIAKPLVLTCQWDSSGQILSRSWNNETQKFTNNSNGRILTESFFGAVPPKLSDRNEIDSTVSAFGAVVVENSASGAVENINNNGKCPKEGIRYCDESNQNKSAIAPRNAKTCRYGYFDKIMSLELADGTYFGFDYYPDGKLAVQALIPQLAERNKLTTHHNPSGIIRHLIGLENDEETEQSTEQAVMNNCAREEFVWDENALICKNKVTFAVENSVRGIPVTSVHGFEKPQTYFINDIYGTTLALINGMNVYPIPLQSACSPN